MYCSEGEWVGRRPQCVPEEKVDTLEGPCNAEDAAECDQACTLDSDGRAMCACKEGYEMSSEGERCEDVDECADFNNGGCDQLCVNRQGGFACECRKNGGCDI